MYNTGLLQGDDMLFFIAHSGLAYACHFSVLLANYTKRLVHSPLLSIRGPLGHQDNVQSSGQDEFNKGSASWGTALYKSKAVKRGR